MAVLFKSEALDLIALGMFSIWADDVFWALVAIFYRWRKWYFRKPHGMSEELYEWISGIGSKKSLKQKESEDAKGE